MRSVFQIGFGRCPQGGGPRLEKIAGDEQLVGAKQALDALMLAVTVRPERATLVGVAEQLIGRLGDRVLNAGALELRDTQGQAVHEQNPVRNEMAASARQFDLELIDDQEVVVLRSASSSQG